MSASVEPEQRAELEWLARAGDRTLSQQVRIAVREHIENAAGSSTAAGPVAAPEENTCLRTTLGLSRELSLEEGTPDEVAQKKRTALTAALRPRRLEVARRYPKWTELEEVDLVPRNRGRWLVSAETDAIYMPVRGVVFGSYSANVIADQVELAFYVDGAGDLVFLERIPGTWSERVARQARKARR